MPEPNPMLTDTRLDTRIAAFFQKEGDPPWDEEAPSQYEDCLRFVAEIEASTAFYYAENFDALPAITDVNRRTELIRGVDGNDIHLFIHEPTNRSELAPAIVHIHGGGMGLLSATDEPYPRWRDELATRGLIVIGVEFRNSAGKLGDHPFPAGLNDCASAVQWAHDKRDSLGISSLVVSGESGGGNLCLATALKANLEGWIDHIDGVYALCPFISGAYQPPAAELASLRAFDGYVLEGSLCQALVRTYDPTGIHAEVSLAFPYHATSEDIRGLPPHVISVNELDPLRDEGLSYAHKLQLADVCVESRTVKGTFHASESDLIFLIPEIADATLCDIVSFCENCRSPQR